MTGQPKNNLDKVIYSAFIMPMQFTVLLFLEGKEYFM